MPEQTVISLGNNTDFFCWRISETLDWGYNHIDLLPQEKKEWEAFHHARQRELVFVRWAIQSLFPGKNIIYDEHGKPYLEDKSFEISISHTDNLVGIVRSDQPIGVDIEAHYKKCSRIYHKFLHPSEKLHLKPEDEDELGVAWCSKEAIYKAIGTKGTLFSEQIVLPTLANLQGPQIGMAFLEEKNFEFDLYHGFLDGVPWAVARQNQVHEAIGI